MDPWDFLKYAAPLATIAGVAFAIVQQMFRFSWRLAQVEQKAASHDDELEELRRISECVPRIEVLIQQLVEDRRAERARLVGT